jgi:hypothetical protein
MRKTVNEYAGAVSACKEWNITLETELSQRIMVVDYGRQQAGDHDGTEEAEVFRDWKYTANRGWWLDLSAGKWASNYVAVVSFNLHWTPVEASAPAPEKLGARPKKQVLFINGLRANYERVPNFIGPLNRRTEASQA